MIVWVVIKILASGSAQAVDAMAEAETPVTAATAPLNSDSTHGQSSDAQHTTAGAAPPREATSLPEIKTGASAGPKNFAAKATGRKTAGKVETPKAASTEAPPAPETEPAIAAPRSAPVRAIEAPRDPWQAMNEALARCAREDFFSRIACEQRLRLQHCANYWGVVPQCPIGPSNDHGQ